MFSRSDGSKCIAHESRTKSAHLSDAVRHGEQLRNIMSNINTLKRAEESMISLWLFHNNLYAKQKKLWLALQAYQLTRRRLRLVACWGMRRGRTLALRLEDLPRENLTVALRHRLLQIGEAGRSS